MEKVKWAGGVKNESALLLEGTGSVPTKIRGVQSKSQKGNPKQLTTLIDEG